MAQYTTTIKPVTIEAPASKVWKILTDLEKYPEWNPFTVKAESTLQVGDPVVLTIPRGGKMTSQTMVLEILDSPKMIAWRMPKMIHKKMFSAYRVQSIKEIDPGRCIYETSDTFSGWIAGRIYKMTADYVMENLTATGAALKNEAEKKTA